jgi:acetyltransferase EpsM
VPGIHAWDTHDEKRSGNSQKAYSSGIGGEFTSFRLRSRDKVRESSMISRSVPIKVDYPMEDLIILGAGGTSREIADTVGDVNRIERRWNLLGFLDDDAAKHGKTVGGLPVLGAVDCARQYAAARFIIGVAPAGDPWRRRWIVERLALTRERFATIIHPSATVSRSATIGVGTAILYNSVVTTDVVIGDHVIIQYNATISHDAVIGDFVTMAPGSLIAGSVRLCAGAYLGAGCQVINDVTVNEAAVVGLGAVVIRDVMSGATVAGNPARPLPKVKHGGRKLAQFIRPRP